jgi:phospholipid/cholesterol/gamma-HCH transport system ATP-binding protein
MEPVIEARDLAMRFGEKTLFKNVSFDVRRGEVFVILGGSGCGKSTLLKLLIGLHRPSAGHARVLGEELGLLSLARAKLGLVGLGDAGGKLPSEISGGMLKRAGIARAMALDADILFLDEPSAGLDPVTSAGLDALIMSLSRETGTTFVVVTHELQSILAIGDRCIMLDKTAQGIIAEGDPKLLRDNATNPTVRAFFRREAS